MLTRWYTHFSEEKTEEQRQFEKYSFELPSNAIKCLIDDKEHFGANVNLSDRDPKNYLLFFEKSNRIFRKK